MDFSKLKALIDTKKQEIDQKRTSGVNAVSIPAGTSRWRILPGWRPEDRSVFSHNFGQHWIKDSAGKVQAVYVCDTITFGKPCGVCEVISEAIRATKDDKALEALRETKSKGRVLVNAICVQGGKVDLNTPVLLALPPSVEDAFVNALHTFYADDVNILDPETGHDIVIEKQGTGLNTKYSITVAPKSSKIADGVMDKVVNIDDWIANEVRRSESKGLNPLNEKIAQTLGVASPVSGLVGSGWTGARISPATAPAQRPALALAPAMADASYENSELDAALMGDTIPSFEEAAPTKAAVKERPVAAPIAEDDLDALLKTL